MSEFIDTIIDYPYQFLAMLAIVATAVFLTLRYQNPENKRFRMIVGRSYAVLTLFIATYYYLVNSGFGGIQEYIIPLGTIVWSYGFARLVHGRKKDEFELPVFIFLGASMVFYGLHLEMIFSEGIIY